jgi:hypothetical protein
MALGSTQPLTEMNTRNLPGGKRRPVHNTDSLTAICEPIVYKMWDPRRLTALWASMACHRDSFTFYITLHKTFFQYISINVSHIENASDDRIIYIVLYEYLYSEQLLMKKVN